MDFDFQNLLKQAQDMQQKMQQLQEKAASEEVVGEAGAGLVKVTMNGRHDVSQVAVDDSLLKEDKEVLEDLLAAAINDAVRRVEAKQQRSMADLAHGFPMPPGFKL